VTGNNYGRFFCKYTHREAKGKTLAVVSVRKYKMGLIDYPIDPFCYRLVYWLLSGSKVGEIKTHVSADKHHINIFLLYNKTIVHQRQFPYIAKQFDK
jgi:hypothetical protein